MPSGTYKRTKENIERIKKLRVGKVPWNKNKKGVQKHSEATKDKMRKSHIGKKHSKKTREKISESNKGKIISKETREKLRKVLSGRKNPISEATIKKISEAKKGKPQPWNSGKNHHNWKGGITSENNKIKSSIEWRLWREAVFARDKWTCQKCERKNNFNPHHIKNFSQYHKLRFEVDNGVTLCSDCHKEFHRIYGRQNNNKKQLKEFLN